MLRSDFCIFRKITINPTGPKSLIIIIFFIHVCRLSTSHTYQLPRKSPNDEHELRSSYPSIRNIFSYLSNTMVTHVANFIKIYSDLLFFRLCNMQKLPLRIILTGCLQATLLDSRPVDQIIVSAYDILFDYRQLTNV